MLNTFFGNAMKLFLLPAMLCLLLGCNINHIIDGVHGNGELKSENRTVATFTKVVVEGSMDVIATAGDSNQTLSINADSNILPIIKTEVKHGELHIYADKSYNSKNNVTITLSAAMLNGLAVEGSGDIKASNLNSDSLLIDIDGSGDIALNGKTNALRIEVNGSGDIRAKELVAGIVQIEINGSGDVYTNVTTSLNVEVNGSGDVEYTGNPTTVNQSVNGSGSVRKK